MGFYTAGEETRRPIPYVRATDLAKIDAILALWEECACRGSIGRSTAELVSFVSLAVHCRRGNKPGGMFSRLLEQGKFPISQREEDEALGMLRRHLGRAPPLDRTYDCERFDSIWFRVLARLAGEVEAPAPEGWAALSADGLVFARAVRSGVDVRRVRRRLLAGGWPGTQIDLAENEWRGWRRREKARSA